MWHMSQRQPKSKRSQHLPAFVFSAILSNIDLSSQAYEICEVAYILEFQSQWLDVWTFEFAFSLQFASSPDLAWLFLSNLPALLI